MVQKEKRVLIVVPAFNEADVISVVIKDLKKENLLWDIAVINDCSNDDTSVLARSTGEAAVIDLPCNLGIGGAVQTGFIYAERNNYDIVIKFDGDGQHRAEEIKDILSPLESGEADMVIGSRFCAKDAGFKSTFLRRTGIRIFRIVNSLLIGQKVTDNTSGFRAYSRDVVKVLAKNYPTDFPEPEEVILLGCRNFAIKEVFVKMRERQGGTSSISGFKSTYYMIKVLLAVIMCAVRNR